MKRLPKFTMVFEPTTIEHLGLKLYASLPPVIGELVSNAWDADAENVEVTVPVGPVTPDSEIAVKDDGQGMSADNMQEAYLRIGRNQRKELATDSSGQKGRALMGRKGLGKLSAFGVASELEVRTVKGGNAVCIRLNYEEMESWPRGKPYEPTVIAERCGRVSEANGTEIRIRKLRRQKSIDVDHIVQSLARRFIVIGGQFKVLVNGREITHKDRRLKEDCKKAWSVADLPGGGAIDASAGWKVEGWIGLVEKASQTERGVDVFARGKAVELDTMFGVKTTHIQFARAYVVGEISANFLDAEEDDISTARNSVQWESEAGQKLQDWGATALKYVFEQWLALQRKEKEQRIVKTEGFEDWLSRRTPHEQRVAKKLIKVIVEDQNIEPESAGPLLEMIKTNIEFQAFQDLVDEIEESGANVETLLRLFKDWRIIEAREHLKLSDGRLEVMEKLSQYIKQGALEVKQIQPLFKENGWLVNPNWTNVAAQPKYTELLQKHCKEPTGLLEKDRRIDILGYQAGGSIHVVELKRPEKTLSFDDLHQIERYVYWARANLVGTGPDQPRYASGWLIVGRLSGDKETSDKMADLAGRDIRVLTFDDLLQSARTVYGQVEETLKRIAPEYSREARLARKKESKQKGASLAT